MPKDPYLALVEALERIAQGAEDIARALSAVNDHVARIEREGVKVRE